MQYLVWIEANSTYDRVLIISFLNKNLLIVS